jgi:single-strand DNA-binding protein
MKTLGPGRLGRDAEVRYTPGGDPVCNLSIAFNYGKKGADGKRPSQWIEASLWGKRAEVLAQYLTKGSMHYFVLSDIHIETYEGRNGQGVKLAALVDDIQLGPNGAGQDNDGATTQSRERTQRPTTPGQPARGGGLDDMDDDIPF